MPRRLSLTTARPGGHLEPLKQPGLRVGSVDDNADFEDFLGYLARIHDLGIATRDFDPPDASSSRSPAPAGCRWPVPR